MLSYRIKNRDIPLGNFDFASEILEQHFQQSIGGYVGGTMFNRTYHMPKTARGQTWNSGTQEITIWGTKRVDMLTIDSKKVFKRHFWADWI